MFTDGMIFLSWLLPRSYSEGPTPWQSWYFHCSQGSRLLGLSLPTGRWPDPQLPKPRDPVLTAGKVTALMVIGLANLPMMVISINTNHSSKISSVTKTTPLSRNYSSCPVLCAGFGHALAMVFFSKTVEIPRLMASGSLGPPVMNRKLTHRLWQQPYLLPWHACQSCSEALGKGLLCSFQNPTCRFLSFRLHFLASAFAKANWQTCANDSETIYIHIRVYVYMHVGI